MEFEEGCMICLEEYSTVKPPMMLPCRHTVCSQCISLCAKEQKSCPYCRGAYRKSEIVPNIDFNKILVSREIKKLEEIKSLFINQVNKIVEQEFVKQQEVLEQINFKKQLIDEQFNSLRKNFIEIIDNNFFEKEIMISKFENEINALILKLKSESEFFISKDIPVEIEKIENNYINNNVKIKLKLFRSNDIITNLENSLNSMARSVNTEIAVCDYPIFATSDSLDLITLASRHNNKNKYIFGNLFQLNRGSINIFKMSSLETEVHNNPKIIESGVCYQLHPNTVVIVCQNIVIYFDSDIRNFRSIQLDKYITGFCLGRLNGDLVIIGGEIVGTENKKGKKVFQMFKRRNIKDLSDLKVSRVNATSESCFNKIYVFGGNSDMSIEVFIGGSWNLLPVKLMNSWKKMFSCIDEENNIYILGGENEYSETENVYVFNTVLNKISMLGSLNDKYSKEANCTCAYYGKKIYYNVEDKIFVYLLDQ